MDDQTGRVAPAGSDAVSGADQDTEERAREIRAEIERTREDLSETVEAIQERLRPGNVMANAASATTGKVKDMAYSAADKAKDMASNVTEKAKDVASTAAEKAEEWWEDTSGPSLMDRIRHNPAPALLIGAGITWMAFSNGRKSRGRYYRSGQDYRSVRGEYTDERRYASGADYDEWREDDRSTTAYTGTRLPRRTVENARSAMVQGRRRLQTAIRDYPLAVGAAATILGVAIGMAVPETERENELMGEARENAVQRAQQAASGAVERVKDAAADVVTRAAIGD